MSPRRAQAGRETQKSHQEPGLRAGPQAPEPQAGPGQWDGRQTQAAQQRPRPPAGPKRQTQGQRGAQRVPSRNRKAAGVRQAWAQAQALRDEGPAQALQAGPRRAQARPREHHSHRRERRQRHPGSRRTCHRAQTRRQAHRQRGPQAEELARRAYSRQQVPAQQRRPAAYARMQEERHLGQQTQGLAQWGCLRQWARPGRFAACGQMQEGRRSASMRQGQQAEQRARTAGACVQRRAGRHRARVRQQLRPGQRQTAWAGRQTRGVQSGPPAQARQVARNDREQHRRPRHGWQPRAP